MNWKEEPQATIEDDELYQPAVAYVRKNKRATISYIQRNFKIGFNRAARIIEAMESQNIVSKMDNRGHRDILEH